MIWPTSIFIFHFIFLIRSWTRWGYPLFTYLVQPSIYMTTQMMLRIIILNEKTLETEYILHDLIYIKFWKMQNSWWRQKDPWLPGDVRWRPVRQVGGRDSWPNKETVWYDRDACCLIVDFTSIHTYVKTPQIVQPKYVQFMVCQLYFVRAIKYNRFLGHL